MRRGGGGDGGAGGGGGGGGGGAAFALGHVGLEGADGAEEGMVVFGEAFEIDADLGAILAAEMDEVSDALVVAGFYGGAGGGGPGAEVFAGAGGGRGGGFKFVGMRGEDGFEVFDVVFGAAIEVTGAAEDVAFGVGEVDGGVAADAELFGEAFVLAAGALGDFFLAGEVEGDEDEVFAGVGFEGSGGENFLIELDAPAAPVGAGEVEEEGFALSFGAFEGFVVVVGPGVGEGVRTEGEEEEENEASFHGGKCIVGERRGQVRGWGGTRD